MLKIILEFIYRQNIQSHQEKISKMTTTLVWVFYIQKNCIGVYLY